MAKKPLSAAQIAHLEQLHRRREAGPATPPAAEAQPETENFLSKLGAALMQASSSRDQRNKTLGEVEAVLSKLTAADYPDLLQNPAVQQFLEVMSDRKAEMHPDDPPGTIYNAGTLAATKRRWQWRDLDKRTPDGEFVFERVTFTPAETIPLTWNGLMLVAQADLEMTVPRVFKDIYDERRRGMETARQHAAYLFRQRDSIDPRRADPSVIGPSSGFVRGHGMGAAGYRPGAGMFAPGEEESEENK